MDNVVSAVVDNSTVKVGGNGLEVKLETTNPGLKKDTNGLNVKLDTTSNVLESLATGIGLWNTTWYNAASGGTADTAWESVGTHFIPNLDMFLGPGLARSADDRFWPVNSSNKRVAKKGL